MGLVGIVEHRGVELYELHIGYRSLGTIDHGDAIASGNNRVGSGQIDSTAATSAHHGHFRKIGINLLRIRIQHVSTIAVDIW